MGEELERIRTLCHAQPNVTERLSHGEPSWFVKDKRQFLTFANHHHDQRLAFWCAAPQGIQEALVQSAPDKFFRPPYVGVRGWLGVYLDVEVDWEEIGNIVEQAYLTIAAKSARPSAKPSR